MKTLKLLAVFVAILISVLVFFPVNSYSDDDHKTKDSTKSNISIKNINPVIKESASSTKAVVKPSSVKVSEQVSGNLSKKPVPIQAKGLEKNKTINQINSTLNQNQSLQDVRRNMDDARTMEGGRGILPENMTSVGQDGANRGKVMNPRDNATNILGTSQVRDNAAEPVSSGRRQPGDRAPSRDEMIGQRTSPQDRVKDVTAPLDMGKTSLKGSLMGKGTEKYSEEGDEDAGSAGEPTQPTEPVKTPGDSPDAGKAASTSGNTQGTMNFPPMGLDGTPDTSDPDYVNSLTDKQIKDIVDKMPVPPLPKGAGANDPNKPIDYMTKEELESKLDITKQKMPSESGEGDGKQIRANMHIFDKINKYKTPAPEGGDRATAAVTGSLHPQDQGRITNPGDNTATGSRTTIDDYIAKPDEGDPRPVDSDDD